MFQAYLHTCHPIERRLIKLYKLINNITNYKLVSEREIIYFLNNIKKKKKRMFGYLYYFNGKCYISKMNSYDRFKNDMGE